MTTTTAPPVVEVAMDEVEAILEEARRLGLPPEHCEKLRAIVESYRYVLSEIEGKKATIKNLRDLVFGAKTETKENVVGRSPDGGAEEEPAVEPSEPGERQPKRKGHGRKAAREYTGAERVKVRHPELKPGARCPCCGHPVYGKAPLVIVRIHACAPFRATVYEKDRLRCGTCGEVFVAPSPPGVGEEKFDATVPAMLGTLRYGNGFPMYRIESLQKSAGVPLPVGTQWKILSEAAERLAPVHEELVRQVAQGVLFINDDTPMKILSFLAKLEQRRERGEEPERTGCQTSGIVAELGDGHRAVLYCTGEKHAGENLAEVLAKRGRGLDTPMQMCDALDRNVPEPLQTIVGNCLAHARRGFVRVNDSFPAEVRYVIDELALVYENEERAKAGGMSPEERIRLHREESGPVMKRLKEWMDAQIEEKKTEPNSRLGAAIAYCRKRWDRLTLFLRQAGAPLDSNEVERMLKRCIIHRKNSLFYKTENGADVGDLFMSLIATAKHTGEDPFDYLTQLLRHSAEIAASPGDWMPWAYRETLRRAPPSV